MKKVSKIIIILILCISLIGCKKDNKEVASNTNISTNTGTASYLYSLKTPYIGNNSALGKILNTLRLNNYGKYSFELKTDKRPYSLTVNYNEVEGWGNILEKDNLIIEKSALLFDKPPELCYNRDNFRNLSEEEY